MNNFSKQYIICDNVQVYVSILISTSARLSALQSYDMVDTVRTMTSGLGSEENFLNKDGMLRIK